MLLSLCVFLPGLTWGLPSRADDRFLFGDRQPWTGEQIIALAGDFDEDAGSADQDQQATAGGPFLNANDADRAQIVRRYRLYSHHPDEMLTFRALAAMAGNRSADPRFYTYGGLWIYPVGALIGAAAAVGWIEVGSLAFYLDHPEEFAKFYVVGRAYAVIWAALGAAIVCVLVRRITRSNLVGVAAAVTYALLPVVVVAAHEAKPHLPGAVLALWAVLPAEAYVRTGRRKHLLWSGILCGAATGVVVTMAVSFVVLPLAWWMRQRRKPVTKPHVPLSHAEAEASDSGASGGRTRSFRFGVRGVDDEALKLVATSVILGILVFVVTNPFVPINLLTDPSALFGNAETTAGHYQFGVAGVPYGLYLTNRALTVFLIAATGLAIIGSGIFPGRRGTHPARLCLLVFVPAMLAWIAFLLTSTDRPPDHVRFALLPALAAVVIGVGGWSVTLRQYDHRLRWLPVILVPLVGWFGLQEVVAFIRDTQPLDSRTRAARQLEASAGRGELTLWADPAPAFTPPFDLWQWKAVMVENRAEVRMTERASRSINWASRAFIVSVE